MEPGMRASELRVGDRIRIVGIPGKGDPNYFILPETKRVYKMLMARKRSVRIFEIDEYGSPWYMCKFKKADGTWDWHYLGVFDGDDNWIPVIQRRTKLRDHRQSP